MTPGSSATWIILLLLEGQQPAAPTPEGGLELQEYGVVVMESPGDGAV